MPDIMGMMDIIKSDIFAYRSVKNELEMYDTGSEKGLQSEYADLAVDSVILRMIEENQMNTDPISLRENFNEILNKFSRIFGVLKQFMITFGQNLIRREDMYNDFEKLHPTKLVQFHKAPLWYQSLVEIASAGGRLYTSDFIEKYPDNHQKLINLSQDHGFIKYERGGEILQLREDICREILFREYATPTTPAETRNREYYQKTFLKFLDIFGEPRKAIQFKMIKEFKTELMSNKIRDHVTLNWIAPLIRNNIKTIDDFIKTPVRDLCKIVSDHISEVSRTMLSMICFFNRDIRSISVEIFDYGIFKKLSKEIPSNLTNSLHQNGINNWGDLYDIDIMKIKDYYKSSRVEYYRLRAFCNWFRTLVIDRGGFYYKAIVDDFPFHENLVESDLKVIENLTKKSAEEYLTIEGRDVVRAYDKGNLARLPPEMPKKRGRF